MLAPALFSMHGQVTTELADLAELPVLPYLDKTDITYRNTSLFIVQLFTYIAVTVIIVKQLSYLHWMWQS